MLLLVQGSVKLVVDKVFLLEQIRCALLPDLQYLPSCWQTYSTIPFVTGFLWACILVTSRKACMQCCDAYSSTQY